MNYLFKQTLLDNLQEREPRTGLRAAILSHITSVERRSAIVRAWVLGAVSTISLFAFIEAVAYAVNEAYLSGFTDYLRLLASDHDIIQNAWSDFALTLAQSLPAVGIILVCATLFAFVWSVSRTKKNIQIAHHLHAAA